MGRILTVIRRYERRVIKGTLAKEGAYKIPDTNLAFMFESCFMLKTTKFAFEHATVEKDYWKCWEGLKNVRFDADE
jgi:homogentisate 1,2-dioxygenase